MLTRRIHVATLISMLSACALSRDGLGPVLSVEEPARPDVADDAPPEPEEEDDEPVAADEAPEDEELPEPPEVPPTAPAPCSLNGVHALRVDADVSWSPEPGWNGYAGWTPAVVAGQGTASLLALVDAQDGVATLHACGVSFPAVRAVTGVTVSGQIPDDTWDAVATSWTTRVETDCDEPGCALNSEFAQPQLGLALPTNSSWPASTEPVASTLLRDDDGDGSPGVPFLLDAPLPMFAGNGYGWSPVQVTQLMLALRVGTRLEGTLDDCDHASGTASELALDSRVLACELDSGSACLDEQAALLQRSLPRWTVDAARWQLVRLPADSGCADVRASL